MYAIGLAYVWRRGGHVRVDLVRDRFPEWFKTIWEIVFTAVFYLPIVGLLTYISTTSAIEAFRIKELYIETLWMPVTWPYKSLVAVGFGLFFLEGINHLLRNIVKALGEEV